MNCKLERLVGNLRVRARHAFSYFFCRYWQHDETGRLCELPFWKTPGRRWSKCNYKE